MSHKLDAVTATVLDAIATERGSTFTQLYGFLFDTALSPDTVRNAAYKLRELGYVDFVDKRAYLSMVGVEALVLYRAGNGDFYSYSV